MGILPSEVDDIGADDWERLVRYYRNEPFGFPREDARMADLTAAVYSAASKKWDNPRVMKPSTWRYALKDSFNVEEVAAEWLSAPGLKSKARGD